MASGVVVVSELIATSSKITNSSNLHLSDKAIISGGSWIYDLRIDGTTGGWTLQQDQVVQGNFYLNDRILDLNGKTMTIQGNLIHTRGTLKVNGGTLIVKGDYRIQTPPATTGGAYTHSSGRFAMTNTADKVLVEGSFTIDSLYKHENILTAGLLEVKGDFTQTSSYGDSYGGYSNFYASGTHKVLLSGNAQQVVSFKTPDVNRSRFNELEITNPQGAVFATNAIVYATCPTKIITSYADYLSCIGSASIGGLIVNIQPSEVAALGAWRLTSSTTWNTNGYKVDLAAGSYTIEFKEINGWIKPVNQIVTIKNGLSTTTTGTYTVVNNNVNTWLILKKYAAPFYIPSDSKVEITEGSESGAVKVAQGAYLNFAKFYGSYVVILEEESSQFTVISAGNNRVNLTSSSGTFVSMAASTLAHTIYFKDGRSLLSSNGSSIMLGTQAVQATSAAVQAPDNSEQPTTSTLTTSSQVNTYLVLTDASAHFGISYGAYAKVYGSDGANEITVESGALVECMNFVGANVINFEDSSSEFKVYRSGVSVYFENETKDTLLKIAAKLTPQTLNFADGSSYTLVISSNKVMLDSQEVTRTSAVVMP